MWRLVKLAGRFALGMVRRRSELVAENEFLRVQLEVARGQIKRARPEPVERGVLAFLSRLFPWRRRGALQLVTPDTLVRWHREGFRIFWTLKSRAGRRKPKVPAEVRKLIRDMALANPSWGVERIVGQLEAHFGLQVDQQTVRKILKELEPKRPTSGQGWGTFLRNHLDCTWACDFLTVPGPLLYHQLYVFFVMRLDTREILHTNVTYHPTDAWIAQQFREVTPWGEGPRYLIRDAARNFGRLSDAVLVACGTKIVVTGCTGNHFAERWVKSVRTELLSHLWPLGEAHLRRRVREYVSYYNELRPHQGLGQQIPAQVHDPRPVPKGDQVVVTPVVGGLIKHFARERPRTKAA